MRLGLVSLILVLALAAPARAQTEATRRAEARALVLQGVKLFEQGDYQTAVERFEEAYARFPTPNILYNLAQGYRELGRDVAAIEAYERFVAEAPSADAETLREARQAAAGLRQRVGSLEMTCDVAGASVAIDGRVVGTTPLARPILLPPGPHQVVVEKAGHSPYLDRIEAQRGLTLRLRVTLERPVTRPAPEATVRAEAPAAPTSTSHAGQVGVFVRADVGFQEGGVVFSPGLSYGLGDHFEIAAAALIGKDKGVWLGATLFFASGSLKPALVVGLPVFFVGGKTIAGGQAGAGLTWDFSRHVGAFAGVTTTYFPSVDSDVRRFWIMPFAGAGARY